MSDLDIHKELFDASVDGDDTRVRELLAAGGNPNKYLDDEGLPALYWVTLWGHHDVLTMVPWRIFTQKKISRRNTMKDYNPATIIVVAKVKGEQNEKPGPPDTVLYRYWDERLEIFIT